jgi:hypothetical protein
VSLPGIRDLGVLLRTMQPRLDPAPYVFATVPSADATIPGCRGLFREDEGTTFILGVVEAEQLGVAPEPLWACITLTVASSLVAVGVLARVVTALAEAGICVNPVAAYHHDHLFVPWGERERAHRVLISLSAAVVETARLRLRQLAENDAAFMRALLNDADFLANVGDRKVRTDADAAAYIRRGPVASYEKSGFGLYLVEEKATGAAAGICGLVRRDTLPDVDVGFAFLPAYRGHGYAVESARAVLAHAAAIGLDRVVAIALPSNRRSLRVLERIGMRYERLVRLSDDGETLALYVAEVRAGSSTDTPSRLALD